MNKIIDSLQGVFKFVKLEPFCNNFTDIDARGGLYHRMNGKSTAKGKTKELTPEDKVKLKAGLTKMVSEITEVIDAIDEAG